jgi:hypothetical protein
MSVPARANALRDNLRILRPVAVWVFGFIAVALIGVSMAVDLSGQSAADRYVLARWSFEGLRVYLWLEGGVFVTVVAALGAHIISTGLAFTRGGQPTLFGIPLTAQRRAPLQTGYVFVVLGAALVALSLTTLVVLNSCRYMRLI